MPRVRLRDIAKTLGISESTVSRALSNKPGVCPELREKIFQAAQDLNYPFKLSRRHQLRRTTGMIVPDLSNPFFATVSYGVASVLRTAGYLTSIVNTDEDSEIEGEHLQSFIDHGIDGIIAAPTAGTEDLYREIVGAKVPIVFIDRVHNGFQASSVTVDNRDAIFQAVRRLFDLGHRRICLVAGDSQIYTGRERTEGFREALEILGLKKEDCPVVHGRFKEPEAYAASKDVLRANRCTAIIATSNKTTCGVLRAIRELNLRIPADISLVGFDDQDWTRLFDPPISAVRQPAFTMGVLAGNLLLQAISGKAGPENIVLKAQLVWRESVGRVGRG